MGSIGHHGPKSSHYLLEEARSTYGQFSYLADADSTLYIDVQRALRNLIDNLTTFQRGAGYSDEYHATLWRLAGNLSGYLGSLKGILQNCASNWKPTEPEGGFAQSQSHRWTESIRTQLLSATQAVALLNESFETSRSGLKAGQKEPVHSQSGNQQYRRFASVSLRLEGLLNSFLYGTPNQSNSSRWKSQDANQFSPEVLDPPAAGQIIARNLTSAASISMDAELAEDDLVIWKIRRALYWFSKNLDDLEHWKNQHGFQRHRLRPNDQAWSTLARIFLDAFKPAWLLCSMVHAYEQLSFELRCFLYRFESKIIAHINSYYDSVFTSPNYELIQKLGDFNFGMDDVPPLQSPRRTFGSSTLECSPMMYEPSQYLPVELEAVSSPNVGSTLATCIPGQAVSMQVSYSNPETSNLSYRSVYPLDSDPIAIVGMMDGLHISNLENIYSSPQIYDIPSSPNELELLNVEIDPTPKDWNGFEYNLSSLDSHIPNSSYIPSRVRIFKLISNFEKYVRLLTYRENLEPHSSLINIPSSEVVLEYAFAKDNFTEYAVAESAVDESTLFLRDNGVYSNLVYKFNWDRLNKRNALELFGFQGALMGAYFGGDYRASRMVLRRGGSSASTEELSPRLQMWTDYPKQSESSDASIVTAQSAMSSISERERKFSALTESFVDNVDTSRMYMFSHNRIYVLIISDRIKLERPHRGLFHRNGKLPKPSIRLVPNKHAGSSAIRIRTLKGSGRRLPGIPLDASGLSFSDQDRPELFESYHSVEVEFNYESDCSGFISEFNECMAGYKTQCAPVEEFRRLQRDKRYEASSTVTFESRKGRRGTN